jgi:hypothetical protein
MPLETSEKIKLKKYGKTNKNNFKTAIRSRQG